MIGNSCWLILAIGLSLPLSVHNIRLLSSDDAWEAWKAKYNKSYNSTVEEAIGRQLWVKEVVEVARHNKAFDLGLESYRQNVYEWADGDVSCKSDRQLNRMLFNWSRIDDQKKNKSRIVLPMKGETIPSDIDYRKLGYVTSVDDQGKCGACWAFAVTGSIEGLMKRTMGRLEKLSSQQLVDCSGKDDGCEGRSITQAMLYAIGSGLQKASDYTYVAKKQDCKYNPAKVSFDFNLFDAHLDVNESDLKRYVATVGPVVATVTAPPSFDRYASGIYSSSECESGMTPDHAVLIVGYGSDKTCGGGDYWLVKNSHGIGWGEQGYMRLARNKAMCQIGSSVAWPIA